MDICRCSKKKVAWLVSVALTVGMACLCGRCQSSCPLCSIPPSTALPAVTGADCRVNCTHMSLCSGFHMDCPLGWAGRAWVERSMMFDSSRTFSSETLLKKKKKKALLHLLRWWCGLNVTCPVSPTGLCDWTLNPWGVVPFWKVVELSVGRRNEPFYTSCVPSLLPDCRCSTASCPMLLPWRTSGEENWIQRLCSTCQPMAVVEQAELAQM